MSIRSLKDIPNGPKCDQKGPSPMIFNGYFLSNAFDTDNMIYNSNKTRSSYNSKNRVYYNLIPKQ